jgi:23S rRNA (uridine2552-2'-O)-methyltransferase
MPLVENSELSGREDFFFIQGDFTNGTVREEIIRRGPYNAIISDAAPLTTGSRTVDTLRSFSLAEEVLSFAERCLVQGGNVAIKVFQGGNTAELLQQLRKCFKSTKSFKPAACRSASFETYYVGRQRLHGVEPCFLNYAPRREPL